MNFMLIDEEEAASPGPHRAEQQLCSDQGREDDDCWEISDIKGELTTLKGEVLDQIVAQAEAAFIEKRGDKKAYSEKAAAKTRREVTEKNKPHVYNALHHRRGQVLRPLDCPGGHVAHLWPGPSLQGRTHHHPQGQSPLLRDGRTCHEGQRGNSFSRRRRTEKGFNLPEEVAQSWPNAAIPMHHYGVIGTLGPSNGATTSGTDKDGKGFPICGALASLALLAPNQGKLNGVRNDFYQASLQQGHDQRPRGSRHGWRTRAPEPGLLAQPAQPGGHLRHGR